MLREISKYLVDASFASSCCFKALFYSYRHRADTQSSKDQGHRQTGQRCHYTPVLQMVLNPNPLAVPIPFPAHIPISVLASVLALSRQKRSVIFISKLELLSLGFSCFVYNLTNIIRCPFHLHFSRRLKLSVNLIIFLSQIICHFIVSIQYLLFFSTNIII